MVTTIPGTDWAAYFEEIKRLKTDMENLTKRRLAQVIEVDTLMQEAETRQAEIRCLKAELADMEAEIMRLTVELAQMTVESAKLKQEYDEEVISHDIEAVNMKTENATLREALIFIRPYIKSACLTSNAPLNVIDVALREKKA